MRQRRRGGRRHLSGKPPPGLLCLWTWASPHHTLTHTSPGPLCRGQGCTCLSLGGGPRHKPPRCAPWEREGGKVGAAARTEADTTPPPTLPPGRITVRCQPPRVVLRNGRFWRWPGRCRSEPLASHRPFPEPRGRPQVLSYSPGLHRSPWNKGLRPAALQWGSSCDGS